jgi:hypothetical protein
LNRDVPQHHGDTHEALRVAFIAVVTTLTVVLSVGVYPPLLFMTQRRQWTWEDVEAVPRARLPAIVISLLILVCVAVYGAVYFFEEYWVEQPSGFILIGSLWAQLQILKTLLQLGQKWTVKGMAMLFRIAPASSLQQDTRRSIEMSLLSHADGEPYHGRRRRRSSTLTRSTSADGWEWDGGQV